MILFVWHLVQMPLKVKGQIINNNKRFKQAKKEL